jgi:hypothetical protein
MDQPILHAKLKALGWHFLYSTVLVMLATLLIYYWYPHWLFWLDGGVQILYLIIPIDLVLGPCLMFVVFNPQKSTREKILDVGVILVLQWCALGYGLWQAMQNRTLALYFNSAELTSCPQSWYDIAQQKKPTHPIDEIQIFDYKKHANFDVQGFSATHHVGECVLSDKTVPATNYLDIVKRQGQVVRSMFPQVKPQDGQLTMLYQGRYGRAVLLLDEKTLKVIDHVKL